MGPFILNRMMHDALEYFHSVIQDLKICPPHNIELNHSNKLPSTLDN